MVFLRLSFTIQHKKLWMLQCRNGKRTAAAAVKIAVDMYNEGMLTKEEAVMKVGADQLDQLLHPMLDPKAEKKVIANGLPASPGAAVGKAVFNAEDAEAWAAKGEKVILIRVQRRVKLIPIWLKHTPAQQQVTTDQLLKLKTNINKAAVPS